MSKTPAVPNHVLGSLKDGYQVCTNSDIISLFRYRFCNNYNDLVDVRKKGQILLHEYVNNGSKVLYTNKEVGVIPGLMCDGAYVYVNYGSKYAIPVNSIAVDEN